MSRFLSLAVSALTLAPAPLLAAPYTYAEFEASVPHIDLETCPEGLAGGDVFCRVSMHNDALHVYVFESGGAQAFVALHSFYEDEFTLQLGQ
ncbi:hypothetical protein [Pararhodobacter sp.]|uniref:hypothetical protein n=1 Tax=Pararhodobacter sp. TaxID=2127056 RepID=UPI002FDCBE3F